MYYNTLGNRDIRVWFSLGPSVSGTDGFNFYNIRYRLLSSDLCKKKEQKLSSSLGDRSHLQSLKSEALGESLQCTGPSRHSIPDVDYETIPFPFSDRHPTDVLTGLFPVYGDSESKPNVQPHPSSSSCQRRSTGNLSLRVQVSSDRPKRTTHSLIL